MQRYAFRPLEVGADGQVLRALGMRVHVRVCVRAHVCVRVHACPMMPSQFQPKL